MLNAARKGNNGAAAYEGVLGAIRKDFLNMVSGGPGWGGAAESTSTMNRYEALLRSAGAPNEVVANLRTMLSDIERERRVGAVSGSAADMQQTERQVLYGVFGRQGQLLRGAMDAMFGKNNVGLEIANLATRDPEVARYILRFQGTQPDSFTRYLAKNAAISAIMATHGKEKRE
jgi:hypothetical protein